MINVYRIRLCHPTSTLFLCTSLVINYSHVKFLRKVKLYFPVTGSCCNNEKSNFKALISLSLDIKKKTTVGIESQFLLFI